MVAQRNALTTQQFNFVPTTLKEAQEFATIFATSGLCPEAYRGRPNDVLIVWQMGKELGLDKMQSLRTLGCINGMPFAYGDGQLALIKRHPEFENMKEWLEGNTKDHNLTAFCMIKRKGQEPVTQSFSMEDAKLAGLWAKKGVWQQYPKRMLQHRARGFAARDAFPDALYGILSHDEAQDIADSKKVTPIPVSQNKGTAGLKETLGIIKSEPEIIEAEIVESEIVEQPSELIFSKEQGIPQDPLTGLEELKVLISRHKVHGSSIKAYLKSCGVNKISELNDDQINRWSNHLKLKEKKNAI